MMHFMNEQTASYLRDKGYDTEGCIILPEKKRREIKFGLGTSRNIKSRIKLVEEEVIKTIKNYETRDNN